MARKLMKGLAGGPVNPTQPRIPRSGGRIPYIPGQPLSPMSRRRHRGPFVLPELRNVAEAFRYHPQGE